MDRGDEARREDAVGPVGQAILAARELLGLEIVCVSRLLTGPERRAPMDDPTAAPTVSENAITMPLESADGHLYGSLVCACRDPDRVLDDRDARFLRVIGRLIGAQIERDERRLKRGRGDAESAAMQALVAAIEARDRYTGEHSRSVVDLSVRVARQLGLPAAEVEQVEQVALLHDVGKVAVPDHVLQKRGALDPHEVEVVRRHPAAGARIVASIAGLAHLAPAIRSGHERWDGHGYPDGLRGEQIPIPSRITAVCDAYDAMVSSRPYREPLGPLAALREIRCHTGTQFCPRAAAGLLAVLGRSRAATRAAPVEAVAVPTA